MIKTMNPYVAEKIARQEHHELMGRLELRARLFGDPLQRPPARRRMARVLRSLADRIDDPAAGPAAASA